MKRKKKTCIILVVFLCQVQSYIYSDGKDPGCLSVTCEHGGTLLPEICTCLCNRNYTGYFCEKELKDSLWPFGNYALPSSMHGCPEPDVYGWSVSYLNLSVSSTWDNHLWEDGDPDTLEPNILGPFKTKTVQINFCNNGNQIQKDNKKVYKWNAGKYCIYRVHNCPEDFQEGNITMKGYDITNRAGHVESADILPNSSIVLHFCCRDDGDRNTPLQLPTSFPFILFKGYSAEKCQEVEGMDVQEDTFFMINKQNDWQFQPPHPNVSLIHTTHVGMPYCYYYPKARRECYYEMDSGFSYNGMVNMSKSGKPCLSWTSVNSGYINTKYWVGEFVQNYCKRDRNGKGFRQPYCYTNKDGTTELCDIPKCHEDYDLDVTGVERPVYHVDYVQNNLPEFAVNGIIDSANSFQSNRPILKPWFQIDLEEYYEVHAIVVYRHKLWFPINFRAVGTYVSKNQWDFLNYGALRCDDLRFPRKAHQYRFQCRRPVTGQYVTIRNLDFADGNQNAYIYLSLNEVKVLGKRTMCGRPLGVITGDIRDFQIESSSELEPRDFFPKYGTLYRIGNGWCADKKDPTPWFMVDLIVPTVVQGVILQGWTVNQQSLFINEFYISFGMNKSALTVYQEVPGVNKTFSIDESRPAESPQRFVFWRELVTRFVRLDITSFSKQACLKLELIGCPKRGVRDIWCTNGSIDLGYEELNSHDFWMEEKVPSPHVNYNISSMNECREECKRLNCMSLSFELGDNCLMHDGQRYSKHYERWWIVASDAVTFSQRLCFKNFLEMNDCGEDIHLKEGEINTIESPGYPLHYGQGVNCVWQIYAKGGKSVRLSIIDIEIPAPVSSVQLKENRFYELNSGYCQDKVIISSNDQKQLVITSDNASKYRGSIVYSSTSFLRIHLKSCFHYTPIKYQNFLMTVRQEDYAGCGMDVEGCRETCTQQAAIIASPRYPARYDANEICYWQITGSFGQYVSFEFLNLDIPEADSFCVQSYVAVYDVNLHGETNLLHHFCSYYRKYEPVITSWHMMRVEFRAGYLHERGSGFLAKYKFVNFTQSYGDISDEGCGTDWYRYRESCYKMFSIEEDRVTSKLTWIDAMEQCQIKGGYLLSIGDVTEMKFIHFLMTNIWKDKTDNEAYIGLSKRGSGDTLQDYSWADGSPLTFTAWFKDAITLESQPDGLSNEQCTTIRLQSIHSMDDWHDVACAYDKVYNYICEKSKESYNISKPNAGELKQRVKLPMNNVTGLANIFLCNNNEMISSALVCNSLPDCSDKSDETSCETKCTATQFECSNGECISLSLYCNFRPDCEDLSDEIDCVHPFCNQNQWECKNGQCIDIGNRCDLKFDCVDKSDEDSCDVCSDFQCYDTKCISNSRVCDGQIDCSGKFSEDEQQGCTSAIQASCSAWWALGVRESGEYLVSFGLNSSVIVECNFKMTEGRIQIYTIVHHEHEEPMVAFNSEIETTINYKASIGHIMKLKQISTCSQSIRLDCHFTKDQLHWVGFSGFGHYLNFLAINPTCSCPLVEKCEKDKTICNCKKSTQDWYTHDQNDILTDEGTIRNQNDLPVIKVHAENPKDLYRYVKFTLGPLVCEEDYTSITSKNLLCRSGITVSSDVLCLLDYDEYGEMKGCRDMSHLDNCESFVCPPGYAKCTNSYCIPVRFVCDKVKHCKYGEDEDGCDHSKCPGFFHCHKSNICLSTHQICDGISHCPEGDDEYNCDQTCPWPCSCHHMSILCKESNITKLFLSLIPVYIRALDFSFSHFTFEVDSLYSFLLLAELNISNCGLTKIHPYSFMYSRNLYSLDLRYNKLSVLLSHTFDGLQNLRFLLLEGNILTQINRFAFDGLSKLPFVNLHGSSISGLSEGSFTGLRSLETLNMTRSRISRITDNTFANLSILISLDLRHNKIRQFSQDIFKGLTSLQYLFSDEFVFCCLRPPTVMLENCFPKADEFSSCSDLIRIDTLRWFLWIIGLCAFLGNVFVLVYRFILNTHASLRSYGVLIFNLSLSDLLMGIYLLIIAGADAYYRNRYIWNDYSWRSGRLCEIAGVLATVSSEASVMFISLITIDRLIAVKFPFGQTRFTRKRAKIAAMCVWVIVLVTGILPTLPIDYFEGFYSRSAVCLALPLTRNKAVGWEYSIAIFIFLNFAMFCLIAVGQLLIYREVILADKIIKSQRRNQDMAVARSLFVIVFTDFLCWFPLGVMGIMVLSGRVIPGEVYAWAAVFILPINSALNPFLYTFSAIMKRKSFSIARTGSKKFFGRTNSESMNSCTVLEEVCSNKQLILGDQDSFKPCLKDCIAEKTLTSRDVYTIVLGCAEVLNFLHQRNVYHGSLSEEVVFPDLENKVVFLQIWPKSAKENEDMPSDVLNLGNLTKMLLRVYVVCRANKEKSSRK